MDEANPVVMQVSGQWHIVEHSRRSERSLCGVRITHRGAHARLSLVGEGNVCGKCGEIWRGMQAQRPGGVAGDNVSGDNVPGDKSPG